MKFPGSSILCLIIICVACQSPFSYSPFETKIDAHYKNTTHTNLKKISLADTSNSSFKVALISDTHYHYNELQQAIEDINSRRDVSFVIVTGDFTENGLKKEYELFHQMMEEVSVPYLTVIGNHDYLSNGGEIYQQMFGDFNYTFSFHGVRFVMFDNVFWESNKAADYHWLEQTLNPYDDSTINSAGPAIVFSHIPPMDGQMSETRDIFHRLLHDNDVKFSAHGHKHEFWVDRYFGDDVTYMTVGSPKKRNYALLAIGEGSVSVDKISF